MLAFFSSNHRPLYKESIYHALSYPNGHVIHLRYKEQWLHRDVLNKLDYYKKHRTECVLFFYEKNNQTFHSIRMAKIIDYKISDVTKQYHFYIELDNFIDKKIDLTKDQGKSPINTIYFSDLDLINGSKNEWFERIDDLKAEFSNLPFFNINGFYIKGKKEYIRSKFKNYESFYELRDNTDYIIKLSLYNTSSNDETYEYTRDLTDPNLIFVNEPSKILVSGSLDDREITLKTNTLESSSLYSYVTYTSTAKDESVRYSVPLQFKIKRNRTKSLYFGLLSTITASCIGVLNYFTKFNYILVCHRWIIAIVIFSLLLSIAELFRVFNKK
ncbi:MAG: hypothetical protein E6Y08_00350 [Paenibacillus sp.]|uniref:hypothetical protein n=1 Tax=Paenibacillus sp. TaxID=58172 RepID=UPI00290F47FB|nr:hypothetical protein [Paenibacillus sp.]MDU4694237.1 hypothetical protein [Paenibacillus sp.]